MLLLILFMLFQQFSSHRYIRRSFSLNFLSSTIFHQSILPWIYIPCSSLHGAYYAELSAWKNMKQIEPAVFLPRLTNHLYLKSSATVTLHSIHYLGSACIIMQAPDRSDRIRASYKPCLL